MCDRAPRRRHAPHRCAMDGRRPMQEITMSGSQGQTRRAVLALMAGALPARAFAQNHIVTVHKDPDCGCCAGWVAHLQKAGFATKVIETKSLYAVRQRLGVPEDLAGCHTAELAGYVVEGHVPADSVRRLLQEKPSAKGLAVPGMPVGSPGMEGGTPERYDVVLFGPAGRRTYMTFVGDRSV